MQKESTYLHLLAMHHESLPQMKGCLNVENVGKAKISVKFFLDLKAFQNQKKIIFVLKFVQNYYIDQNLAKVFHKTPKTANFSLSTFYFSKFSAMKIFSFIPKNHIFSS